MAQSDVLILLDCCWSGVANDTEGNGITELICACPFDGEANGVGHYSFTQALTTELRLLSKKPRFSVGQLYTSIYTRMQSFLRQGIDNERYPPPVHFVLTQDEQFVRGIQLSVYDPKASEGIDMAKYASPEVKDNLKRHQETEPLHPSKKRCTEDGSLVDYLIARRLEASEAREPKDQRSEVSQPSHKGSSSPESTEGYPEKSQVCQEAEFRKSVPKDSCPSDAPRALFVVRFTEDVRAEHLSVDLFKEWLRSIPAPAEEVRIEASFDAFSTLLLITLPLAMWSYIPQDPAIFALGPVKSSIILPINNGNNPLTQQHDNRSSNPSLERNKGEEKAGFSTGYEPGATSWKDSETSGPGFDNIVDPSAPTVRKVQHNPMEHPAQSNSQNNHGAFTSQKTRTGKTQSSENVDLLEKALELNLRPSETVVPGLNELTGDGITSPLESRTSPNPFDYEPEKAEKAPIAFTNDELEKFREDRQKYLSLSYSQFGKPTAEPKKATAELQGESSSPKGKNVDFHAELSQDSSINILEKPMVGAERLSSLGLKSLRERRLNRYIWYCCQCQSGPNMSHYVMKCLECYHSRCESCLMEQTK